jgi:conjugative relaxase-like TrwC/TraI family protein
MTARMRPDRVAALEICFGPPKSVSLAIEYAPGGMEVLHALADSIRDTLAGRIELLAQARVRKDGRMEDRLTGNVAGVLHMHGMARPVGGTPMPHWHGHLVLGNVTWDALDGGTGQWKALKMRAIMDNAPEIEAMFHGKLREKLHGLGYRTKGEGRNWEIVGVPRSVVEKFSERHGVIQRFRQKVGKVWKRDYAALMTREEKPEHHNLAGLRRAWDSRLTPRERDAFRFLQARPKVGRPDEILRGNKSHLQFLHRVATIARDVVLERGQQRHAHAR